MAGLQNNGEGLGSGIRRGDATAQSSMQLASARPNPVLGLPGMSSPLKTQLPGMRVLPREVISDLINIPNPFDSRKTGREGQTQIAYTLSSDARVTVTMYNLLGSKVRHWDFAAGDNGGRAGSNQFLWDGTNEAGQKVAKGGYLAQIEIDAAGTFVSVIRKIGIIH